MDKILFADNAKTTLTGDLTDSGTSISCDDTTDMPTPSAGQGFYATLYNAALTLFEVVWVTANSANTLTVTRIAGTPLAWSTGDNIGCHLTATLMGKLLQTDNDGNARGSNAVNVQPARTAVDHVASGAGAIAVGYNTEASGDYTVALGYVAGAYGDYTIGIGYQAIGGAADGIAIGRNAVATSAQSIAIGVTADGHAVDAISIGRVSDVTGTRGVAVGCTAVITGADGIAIGYNSYVTAADGISIGAGSQAYQAGAIAIGDGSWAEGTASVAIGVGAGVNSSDHRSIAIGPDANSKDESDIAIGDTAVANQDYSIAIGTEALTKAANAIVIGQETRLAHAGWKIAGPQIIEPIPQFDQIYYKGAGHSTVFLLPPVALHGGTAWAGSSTYYPGNVVIPTTPNGYQYYLWVNPDATNQYVDVGSGEPTWPTTVGNMVDADDAASGDYKWVCIQPTNIVQLALPSGLWFLPEAFGIVARAASSVSVQPTVSFSSNTGAISFVSSATTSGLTASGSIWWAGSPTLSNIGYTALEFKLNTAATATNLVGQPLIKGQLLEI